MKDAVAGNGLANVTVSVQTTGGDALATATTDATGHFTATAPIGTVELTFAKQYYTSPGALLVGVVGGVSTTANATMAEAASGAPSVAVSSSTDVGYGVQVPLTATASDPNGYPLTYTWANGTLPVLGSVSGSGASATVTMPAMTDAFAKRYETSTPSNQYVSGYAIGDQFGVLPIMADTRGEVSVSVTVDDGHGQTSTASVTIDAASILTGVQNVAVGTRVYLNSGHDGVNQWSLVPASGSTASLVGDTTRTASFVPDVKGDYVVSEGSNTMTVHVGDWVGMIAGGSGNTVTVNQNCTACHNDAYAVDEFTPWTQTAHATMFTHGVNGGNGTHYGPSCIVCHTVGYDKGVRNNGFDDVAATAGWTWPGTATGNWDAMVANYPTVAQLANIQCENCHGPQNSDAHTATGALPNDAPWTSPRIGYSAEVCGTCHASGTGHHNYSEWSTSDPTTGYSHSNRAPPESFGVSAHCGRCHTAQGYGEYADQLAAGNPGNLASIAGLTTANAQPVTCSACHDPHDATNPSQLRVYDDTTLLPGGFRMTGVGKGALCMTCHNSRNGVITGTTTTYLHEDTETYNGGNPVGYSAPHQACQGDVFAGRNAYFLGASTPMTSKHAAIADACVGCHMVRNPETHVAHGSPAVSEHVFRITDANRGTLCAGCHGTTVNGDGLAASFDSGIESIGAKVSAAVQAKAEATGIFSVIAYDPATGKYSTALNASGKYVQTPVQVDLSTNPLKSVTIDEIHGQIGFDFTFTNPVSFNEDATPVSLASFGVQLGSLLDATGTTALFQPTGTLVKAGWNYFLLEGDQSHGLHNPSFVQAVIDDTMAQTLN